MEKYFKITKESLNMLAGKVSGRLRTSSGVLEVVSDTKRTEPSESMEGMLRDLVAFRTVSGEYDENHSALEYIDNFLSERALHVKRFEWNGFESLVATTQRTLTPKVMIVIHQDVVPAPAKLFKLREKDGKYYGRGVFDMKFAIPPSLQLIDELDSQEQLHQYDFGIMVTTDEEVGGFDGVARLIEEGYLPGMTIVADGGDNWKMETFCKGLWLVTLTAKGKNAHGSRPWEGISANAKMIDAVQAIQALFPGTGTTDSTITIAMMHGGTAINQVADEATVSLDMRFGSQDEINKLVPAVRKICASKGLVISDEIYSEPVVNSLDTPIIASFTHSIQKVTGHAPDQVISHAGADARHFAAKGIPCAIVRPPGGNLHGPGEWVSKEGLYQFKDILKDFIEREALHEPKQPQQ
jgi:succinyl-diaminopimelate desuccinylase